MAKIIAIDEKIINNQFNRQIAECIGLWLAEGDNKCTNEITFTNNCFDLIKHFHNTITKLFKEYNFNIRIYVYSKNKLKIDLPIKDCITKYYSDKRAKKPYFIWRICSVKLNRKWKNIVEAYKPNSEFYPEILRGFFAGEGNIKIGSHNSRVIRIAQKNRVKFIENILDSLKIEYKFKKNERSYCIYHKDNWDIFSRFGLADLHPIKKNKFYTNYNFKEEHYKHNYLKKEVFKELVRPHTTIELSKKFNRSPARICDIVIELKKEGLITNFGVKSTMYWIRNDKNSIIISQIKEKYINIVKEKPLLTSEIAKTLKVDWKNAFKRLKELEKLKLVQQINKNEWGYIKTSKRVIVI